MSSRSFFYPTDDAPFNKERFEQESFMNAKAAEALRDFAEESSIGLMGLETKTVFEQLERRYPDLLSALQCFTDQECTDDALRLAISLAQFWMATKRLKDGTDWFDRVLTASGGQDIYRGEAAFQAGLLSFWQGNDDRAAALHNHALEIGRRAGNATIIAEALTGLARIALRSDLHEARRLCQEALAVTEGTADQQGQSNAIHVLGVVAQMTGDFQEARTLMNARIKQARAIGNFRVISSEACNLSMVERQLGNLDQAEVLAAEALTIDYQRADHWAMPYKVSGLAAVSTERREYKRAAMLVGIAEAMMEAEKADWPPDEWPHYERMVTILKSAMGTDVFEQTRAIGYAMTIAEAVNFALQPILIG